MAQKLKKRSETSTRCDALYQKTLWFDMYQTPFQLLLPDHNENYRTFVGSILSLLTMTILLAYMIYKAQILFELDDYSLEKAYEENFFPSDEAFSQKDGFYIAAALTNYDGSSEVIEDPTIGTLKMYIKSWDVYD